MSHFLCILKELQAFPVTQAAKFSPAYEAEATQEMHCNLRVPGRRRATSVVAIVKVHVTSSTPRGAAGAKLAFMHTQVSAVYSRITGSSNLPSDVHAQYLLFKTFPHLVL